MLNIINTEHLINQHTENHCCLHTKIDPAQYPQIHDFYEIIVVLEGILELQLCGESFTLVSGSLAFIRPGDIHSKTGNYCIQINLAFLAETFDTLFEYLGIEEKKAQFFQLPFIPPVHLKEKSLLALEEKMQLLSTIPVDQWRKSRWILRKILFEIVTNYLSPVFSSDESREGMPKWLVDALNAWNTPEHRQESLSFFCQHTGLTKEHICRTFRRYLGTSLTEYLNKQRINHAVNLLLYSNNSTLYIAYEAGFKSLSRFYHIFHETYGISPKQFCIEHHRFPVRGLYSSI